MYEYLERCDFQGNLNSKKLKMLAEHVTNEEDRKHLQHLASPKGKKEFKTEIRDQMVSLIDLIEKYKIRLTLD